MKHFAIALLFILLTASIAHAADTVLEVGIPGVPGAAPGDPAPGIVKYISFLYTFVLGFVGIAGFASLVFWGAVWTGSGIIDKKRQAIDGIKNAITGIAIALTAFIILNTINPDLTMIKLPAISDVKTTSRTDSFLSMDAVEKTLIVDYIKQIFGPDAAYAMKIADCESKLNSTAVSKTNDIGVFQINLAAQGGRVPGSTNEEKSTYLKDYKKNIAIAQAIKTNSGWDAWFMSYKCHSPNNTAMAQKYNDYCSKNPKTCGLKIESLQAAQTPAQTTTQSKCAWYTFWNCF